MIFKKEKEVKTHIPEPDFDEFLSNLANDGLNRSEWMRLQIDRYNLACRERRQSSNVFNIFSRD